MFKDSNTELIRRTIDEFIWQKAFLNKHIDEKVDVFNKNILKKIVHGAKETTLNMHRYITYTGLNYSSKYQVKPEKLPPTETAAECYSLRVHCQILKSKNEDETDFSPTQWEWKNCLYTQTVIIR